MVGLSIGVDNIADAIRHLEERLDRQAVIIEALVKASPQGEYLRRQIEVALTDWETDRAGVLGD